jgi:hypothetical protein
MTILLFANVVLLFIKIDLNANYVNSDIIDFNKKLTVNDFDNLDFINVIFK